MSKVIAEVTIVPLGTGSPSLSHYVAEVEKVIEKFPAIKTMLTPMGTILEGEWDEVMNAVKLMHESPFLKGAKRVSTRISIDDRRDKDTSMEKKVSSVKKLLEEDRKFSRPT